MAIQMKSRVMASDFFAIADSLEMVLSLDAQAGKITGETTKEVDFTEFVVPVPLKVVSSLVTDLATILIVRSLGNLAFLIATNYSSQSVMIGVLDLVRMDKPEGLLETHAAMSADKVWATFGPALVQSFQRDSAKNWKKVA